MSNGGSSRGVAQTINHIHQTHGNARLFQQLYQHGTA